jgi:uncharacterized protein involved in cysteine biosynthesis
MFRARPAGPASGFATAARGSARGAGLLARIVHLVVSVVVLIGVVLVVLKANPANSIVSEVHDWARWLAGPFDGMFTFDNARVAVAVNWGIAAVVYLFVGALIARLLGRSHR